MDKERDGFPLTAIREVNILLSFHHAAIVDVSEVSFGALYMTPIQNREQTCCHSQAANRNCNETARTKRCSLRSCLVPMAPKTVYVTCRWWWGRAWTACSW